MVRDAACAAPHHEGLRLPAEFGLFIHLYLMVISTVQVCPMYRNTFPELSGRADELKTVVLLDRMLSTSVGTTFSFGTAGICGIVKMALDPSRVNMPVPVGQARFSAPSN